MKSKYMLKFRFNGEGYYCFIMAMDAQEAKETFLSDWMQDAVLFKTFSEPEIVSVRKTR